MNICEPYSIHQYTSTETHREFEESNIYESIEK